MANRKRPHFVGVWLSDNGVRAIDDRAVNENLSRSEMVRRMLAYAAQHMPRATRPP